MSTSLHKEPEELLFELAQGWNIEPFLEHDAVDRVKREIGFLGFPAENQEELFKFLDVSGDKFVKKVLMIKMSENVQKAYSQMANILQDNLVKTSQQLKVFENTTGFEDLRNSFNNICANLQNFADNFRIIQSCTLADIASYTESEPPGFDNISFEGAISSSSNPPAEKIPEIVALLKREEERFLH